MERLVLPDPIIDPTAFVAPTANIFGDVTIEARAVVMFGVVMRAELDRIVIGTESNIQDNAVFHTDETYLCSLGHRVTVGHGAIVHGATIGDRCLVGIGSIALNGSKLGEGAWLAAGSVLPEGRSIPPWTLAVGTPAKPIRDLTEDEVLRQDDGVETYLRFAEAYRTRLP
ncbi:MAG: gamma carbonic anhydrase family protein [Actinomycetia bacterium]|nr:gamma carbonic anhydrase family protein [Actinomycetes bacterium]